MNTFSPAVHEVKATATMIADPNGEFVHLAVAMILQRKLDAASNRVEKLESVLRELVACKDMKDQFDALKQDVPDVGTAIALEAMAKTYQERKPAAWAAARSALEQEESRDA